MAFFSVIQQEEPFRQIINVRDNRYIVSTNRFNAQSQPFPIKIGGDHESSSDCIWTGEYYYVRGTYLDGYWPNAEQYALPLCLYDENGNQIKAYELNKRENKDGFGQHVIKIGYLNGVYYASLRSEWQGGDEKTIKSTDFENWEITDEEVPQVVGNIMISGDKISSRGRKFTSVHYEDEREYTLFYTLGDWIIVRDDEGDFYFSNDNIYFVKLNSPEELKKLDIDKMQSQDNPHLLTMKNHLKQIEKELDNVMTAIKQGIYSPTIKGTLDSLEQEKADLELSVTKAEIEHPVISKEQIKFWICQFKLIDKNDITQKQKLIDIFVNSVYVYDDKMLITYNYKDGDKCIDYNEIQEYLNKKENSDNHKDYQSLPLNCFGMRSGARKLKWQFGNF